MHGGNVVFLDPISEESNECFGHCGRRKIMFLGKDGIICVRYWLENGRKDRSAGRGGAARNNTFKFLIC